MHRRFPTLRLAQALTLMLAAASIALVAIGLPAAHEQLTHPPHAVLISLAQSGFPRDAFIDYLTAFNVLGAVIFLGLGLLILYRRFTDSIGLVTGLLLILFAAGDATIATPVSQTYPSLGYVAHLFTVLMLLALTVFLFVFPDGRVIPRWSRTPLILWCVGCIAAYLVLGPSLTNNGFTALQMVGVVLGLTAQAYRYRRVSTERQRQQTKWIFFGTALAIGVQILVVVLQRYIPTVGIGGTPFDLTGVTILSVVFALIPISITIAILRYHLWDIDVLINRTLVYGSLTVSLAVAYILGVIGIQALLRTATGQSSQLTVAVVTLAIAALFNPWRRRLQTFVDHRFYRQKYDAARTLASFQARLRNEVDLDQLDADMMLVLQETLQPASAGIWLGHVDATEPGVPAGQ